MNKHDVITYDNLPEAVKHLLHEVADIKNYLLNQAATPAETNQLAPEGNFLTVSEVSQMLKISRGAVYNMTSTRQIPFFKNAEGFTSTGVRLMNGYVRTDAKL